MSNQHFFIINNEIHFNADINEDSASELIKELLKQQDKILCNTNITKNFTYSVVDLLFSLTKNLYYFGIKFILTKNIIGD
jgi:hypothetical protein